ncbi:MAG TPA: hypothetical protein VEK56_04450 [Vicinamibacterales bacterium]|nr:hypothetical protein [Vicinamibacterales bacterium]
MTERASRGETNGLSWSVIAAGVALGGTVVYLLRRRWRANAEDAYDNEQEWNPYQTESITINQPIERVYAAWLERQYPSFMRDAEITDSREQERCVFQSNEAIGTVLFQRAPGARGTEVHVELERKRPVLVQKVTRVLGIAPDQQIREDLRRFKQLLETGEITVSDGPGLWRAAQPGASIDQVTAFSGGRQ